MNDKTEAAPVVVNGVTDEKAAATIREYVASAFDYTPHPTPRMTPEVAEQWLIEAVQAGLTRAETERRMAEQRAGSDERNNLHILLDTPGNGVEPVKTWFPLRPGIALLLDDSTNPELAHLERVKQRRADWAREERNDRRQHHLEREAARKREIDQKNAQILSRVPNACAFAQMALESEGVERTMWQKVARLVFAYEAAGVALRTPSKDMAKVFGLEVFEPTPFSE